MWAARRRPLPRSTEAPHQRRAGRRPGTGQHTRVVEIPSAEATWCSVRSIPCGVRKPAQLHAGDKCRLELGSPASRPVGGSTRSRFARHGHATPAFRLIGSEKILDGVDFALADPGECEGDFAPGIGASTPGTQPNFSRGGERRGNAQKPMVSPLFDLTRASLG
jgi:hypothetical protein